jgi:diadenosine tetraphosphate (Ap4A) HIT family hydrolase
MLNSSGVASGDCVFCRIAAGRAPSWKVYEDSEYVAFLDIQPFSRGHTLVCPKRHGETIWDMNEAETAGLFRVAFRVSKAVVGAMGADGFRFVQNNGDAANQAVPHVHVHVIPVMMQDKGRYGGRKTFSPGEMETTAGAIREKMKQIP